MAEYAYTVLLPFPRLVASATKAELAQALVENTVRFFRGLEHERSGQSGSEQ